ncbi:MAG: hypothetical protein ACTHK2_08530 [Dokdonella sp.]|uniref:hypothetical protein n=1 Tax=Dokdonella sp. TaxID=2291710 RepID=UPI003F7E22E3
MGGVWHGFGGLAEGCGGPVAASAFTANGDLYVAGGFGICGNRPANSVARWDGTTWSAAGSGSNSRIEAMIAIGNDIYVAGQISEAGGVPVSGVARWDGTQWHALGEGIFGFQGSYFVYALAASGNDLYVGGTFDTAGGQPAASIARWNTVTQAWSPLGSGMTRPGGAATVRAITVQNGVVYAGGDFAHAGGVVANHVAAWNGSAWSQPGDGFDYDVHALAGWNGAVYAGGEMHASGLVPIASLARLDGNAWVEVGGGVDGRVDALVGTLSGLFVGGDFDDAGGAPHENLALWNGSTFVDVGGGVQGGFGAVSTLSAGVVALAVGGDFHSVGGGTPAHSVALWTGSWSALAAPPGHGLFASPLAAATHAFKPCFGGFGEMQAGAGSIACWDGNAWTPLISAQVPAIATALTASGDDLYIGGYFYPDPGSCCIRRWDGATAHDLGQGTDSGPMSIAVDAGNVYASGWFSSAGGVPADNVAMWDGAAWHAFGGGIASAPNAVAWYQGRLYATGYFTDVGGVPMNHIAAWDGSAWVDVAGGIDGQGMALAVRDGSLYVGGYFSQAGGVPANSLARWDGTQWSAVTTPLGNGVTYLDIYPGFVAALAATSRGVFVGGQFDKAGGARASGIALIDDGGVHALGFGGDNGVGLEGYVGAITARGDDVFIGGQFAQAGGQLSANVARFAFADDMIFASGFE